MIRLCGKKRIDKKGQGYANKTLSNGLQAIYF